MFNRRRLEVGRSFSLSVKFLQTFFIEVKFFVFKVNVRTQQTLKNAPDIQHHPSA